MLSPSRWNSDHTTEINAPIDIVWESLSDIHSWGWNKWIRLDAEVAMSGASGKASVSYDAKKRRKLCDFSFGKVTRDDFVFEWRTSFGLCNCTNTMELVSVGTKRSQLRHTQTFQGLLPGIGMGHPFKKLKSHALCMNEGLKNHVESLHFNSLLFNISAREMPSSSSTLDTESPEDSSRASFWETPRSLRKELISSFIDERMVLEQ
jgi:hypothetical protein